METGKSRKSKNLDKKWYEENRGKVSEYNRARYDPEKNKIKHLKYLYNLSWDEYQDLLKKQNYKCAICTLPFQVSKGYKGPHVDHCHINNKVRGLLCWWCNRNLGWYEKYK